MKSYLYSGTAEHPVYADVVAAMPGPRRHPIVMLHGGFHNGAGFLATPDGREGWASIFARRGHDVYVMDWPGHGRSPAGADFVRLSMADVGRALGALLQDTGPAIVFAHSAGGPIAWWVAEQYRTLVAAVVGLAPGPPANLVPALPAEPAAHAGANGGAHPVYAPADRPAFVDRAFIKTFWANGSRFPQAAFEAYARSIGPESPRILNERFNIGGSGLRLSDHGRLRGLPMLVLTGDEDPRHPKALDGALAAFLGSDFLWLPAIGISGNGHMLMIEDNHQELAARVAGWLGDHGL
ncbi:alpha/beta fold hydrolase [Bordetella hinzii]|uniref:alpha/beta fold hydrolase n=1 Tax=Bordetella hinzii TaxID=103855 RepID=UPI0039FC23C4